MRKRCFKIIFTLSVLLAGISASADECSLCTNLTGFQDQLKTMKLSVSAPRATKLRRDLELDEARVFNSAGSRIVEFLKEKNALAKGSRPAEFAALALFLAKTNERDRGHLTLDLILSELGSGRAAFLRKFEAEIDRLEKQQGATDLFDKLRDSLDIVTTGDQG